MFFRSTKADTEALIQAGYRYAQALQPDQGEARGLVHEAWLRVSERGNRRPDKALLFRAIRNLHIDLHRREQRVPFSNSDYRGVAAGEQAGDADVAELPDAQLQRALAKLREHEREELFLSVVEGYTADEISTLTQSPRGTVLSLIHRARVKLRNCLHEETVTTLPVRTGRSTS